MATVTTLETEKVGVVVTTAPLADIARLAVQNALGYQQTSTCLAIDVQQSNLTVDEAAWLIVEIYDEFERERQSPAQVLPSIVLFADSFSDQEYVDLVRLGVIPIDRSKPWNSDCQVASDLRQSLARLMNEQASRFPPSQHTAAAERRARDPELRNYLNAWPRGMNEERLAAFFRHLNSE